MTEHADAFNAGIETAALWHDGQAERLRTWTMAGLATGDVDPEWPITGQRHTRYAADLRSLKVHPDISADAFRRQRDEVVSLQSGDGALGAISGNSASEWQDGPEPVCGPGAVCASTGAAPTVGWCAGEITTSQSSSPTGYGYWNPSILDRLRGWLR